MANPLREMVRTNVIEHKILDNIMYIDFFAVNMKVIIMIAGVSIFTAIIFVVSLILEPLKGIFYELQINMAALFE